MYVTIPIDELRPGMYVQRVNGAWLKHPFWRTSFLATEHHVQRLRDSGVASVDIDPSRSQETDEPPPAAEPDAAAATAAQGAAAPEPAPEPAAATVSPRRAPVPQADLAAELTRARRICQEGREAVEAMFQEVRLGRIVDTAAMVPLAQEINASVGRHPGALIGIARIKTVDDYTYLHSVAVGALMSNLARRMGMDEQACQEATLGGLLHDLGKACVPLEILNKPGRLEDAEMELMRAHPAHGARLLGESGVENEAILHMVLHHHERMDGTGYPARLAEDELPLLTRMSSVCDVYDAVTSTRAYKEPWDPAEALRRMASWKGHFDPVVLKALIASLGIYPAGSLVKLSSERLAVVLEQRPDLTRPLVRVFYSARLRSHVLHVDLDLSAPGCNERITGIESPREWGFRDLHKLWAP
jgi:uncharacterized domain HDIG